MAVSSTNIVPLHLSGNTTEQQEKQLEECLAKAVRGAYEASIDRLDRQSAHDLLEAMDQLGADVSKAVGEVVQQHSVSGKFKDEEVSSDRIYPATYRLRPIEAQVTALRNLFPQLKNCLEKLGHLPVPDGPEGWFAIPRWQAVAPTYSEAVERMLEVIGSKRRFSNRIVGRLGEKYMRQTERSKLGELILADQQAGNDILVVAAQAGMLHRGCSARRTRAALASNEFGLGVFAIASMLLTHPERLSDGDALMIDCGGDEYSPRADYTFDRVPLFDYDLSGIEFSMFYEDRARNLWGTPTGFLYKVA